MTFSSNLKAIGSTIIIFLIPVLFFLVLLIINYTKTEELSWKDSMAASMIFFLIISIMTVPGFILHLRYYLKDRKKTLRFRPTYFELSDLYKLTKIYFTDINKIEHHHLFFRSRNPWRDYGYIKVLLNDGSNYTYNSLTFDHSSSAILFRSKNVVVEDFEDLYPW